MEAALLQHWTTFCAEVLGPSVRSGLRFGPSLSGPALDRGAAALPDDERARFAEMRADSRRGEWVAARVLRRELEAELGPGASLTASHSAGWALVAGVVAGGARGVGVDLELASRLVSPAVGRRILLSGEDKFGLSHLELWTLKEAAYKADPLNRDQVVTSYRVESWSPETARGRAMAPAGVRIEVQGLRAEGWRLAFAIALG